MKKTLSSKAFLVLAILAAAVLVLTGLVFANDPKQQSAPPKGDLDASMESMGHAHHHEMGPHMYMSALRDPQPGDEEKAQKVVDEARQALEKYKDYKTALSDGYKIFLPNIPQKMYHFTNNGNAIGEAFRFDASRPTSLLYEKNGNDYKLIGAMYTAPLRVPEDKLNDRIPLSMAQWHQHVNMCKPPKGREFEMLSKAPRFGLAGSISSRDECEAAGGTFMPHLYGWMVHMYPWEKTSDKIWSVERQAKGDPSMEHHHDGMNH